MRLSTSRLNGTQSCWPVRTKTKPTHANLLLGVECLPAPRFVEFCSVVAERQKISQPIKGQGGHRDFPIGPLRSCFLSSFIEFCYAVANKKSKMSQPSEPGQSSWFSDRPEKYKLGRGRWDLSSSAVSLNSFRPLHRRQVNDGQQSVISIVHLSIRPMCT